MIKMFTLSEAIETEKFRYVTQCELASRFHYLADNIDVGYKADMDTALHMAHIYFKAYQRLQHRTDVFLD
jgi:hypothetical protein